jgi:hypothetical protein
MFLISAGRNLKGNLNSNGLFHAKAQRKTQRRKGGSNTWTGPKNLTRLCVFASSFAPLREEIVTVQGAVLESKADV